MQLFYTIAVRGALLPLWRKYRVLAHEITSFGRLELKLASGELLSLPGVDRRPWRLYPDYKAFLEAVRWVRSRGLEPAPTAPPTVPPPPPAAPRPPIIDPAAEAAFNDILESQVGVPQNQG